MDKSFFQDMNEVTTTQAPTSQNFFEDYEWMVDMEEFDEDAIKKFEMEEEDLDDLFYWDVDKGTTTAGKGDQVETQAGGDNRRNYNSPRSPNYSQKQPPRQQQQQSSHHGRQQQQQQQSHTFNPLYASNNNSSSVHSSSHNSSSQYHHSQQRQQQQQRQHFYQPPQQQQHHQQQRSNRQTNSHTFNPLAGPPQGNAPTNNNNQSSISALTNSMQAVDIHQFNFNPEATSFVPSWLTKK